LNNVIEQDHRNVKKRAWLAKGYGSFQRAWRTLQGIETIHMIRKGRVRWLAAHDARARLCLFPRCSASPPINGSHNRRRLQHRSPFKLRNGTFTSTELRRQPIWMAPG
jgi:hypothetical protein